MIQLRIDLTPEYFIYLLKKCIFQDKKKENHRRMTTAEHLMLAGALKESKEGVDEKTKLDSGLISLLNGTLLSVEFPVENVGQKSHETPNIDVEIPLVKFCLFMIMLCFFF